MGHFVPCWSVPIGLKPHVKDCVWDSGATRDATSARQAALGFWVGFLMVSRKCTKEVNRHWQPEVLT